MYRCPLHPRGDEEPRTAEYGALRWSKVAKIDWVGTPISLPLAKMFLRISTAERIALSRHCYQMA